MDRFLPKTTGFSTKAICDANSPCNEKSKPINIPIYISVGYVLDDLVAPASV